MRSVQTDELDAGTEAIPSRAEIAYAAIKRDIICCQLEPGRRISKAELAVRYGLGQSVIREALNRLYQERLVFAIPREGYKVASVTLKQVLDLFGARLVLEPALARLAAGRVDGERLWALDTAGRSHYHFTDLRGQEAYVRTNSALHLAVADASGNARLAAIMRSLLDEMERVMHLSYILSERNPAGDRGHGDLIEALVAGDGERAAQASSDQLQLNRQFVLDALLSAQHLQGVNLMVPAGR